jgi:hypothetical protein
VFYTHGIQCHYASSVSVTPTRCTPYTMSPSALATHSQLRVPHSTPESVNQPHAAVSNVVLKTIKIVLQCQVAQGTSRIELQGRQEQFAESAMLLQNWAVHRSICTVVSVSRNLLGLVRVL